jgi:Protein of unknown function (DUF1203)
MHVSPLPTPLTDDPGAVRVTADEAHAFPCRRCLRDAEPGDAMVLMSYDPFTGDSPYSGPGPIYVHEHECTRFDGSGIPDQLTRRMVSVRAYDREHMMVGAKVTDGTELETVAGRLLSLPGAAYVHVHNALPGCFAARIDR